LIWGPHRRDPLFHTHHSFWEATLQDHPNIFATRYTWEDWEDMPKTFDLYFFVDFHPSLYKLARHSFKNTVLYWWDSFHRSLCVTLQAASLFNRVYFAEKLSALQANAYGLPVHWLPAAFYQKLYGPISGVNKVHHYAFIGHLDDEIVRNGDTRKSLIVKLSHAKDLHGYVGEGVYGSTVNQIYNESEILLDRTIFANIGTRFFETIGSGGLALVNRPWLDNGLAEIATEGVHYAAYDDTYPDFEAKFRYYLDRPEERQEIAFRGYKHFVDHHTYAHRLETILSDMKLK